MWRISGINQKEIKMKLGDLIKNSSWLSVEIVFSRLFPDQITYLDDYRTVYDELKVLKPKDTNISIITETVIDDFDNEEYVSVSGYDSSKTPELKDEITESLALEFTSWSEWLDMTIDNDSINHFSPYEIICYCLHEMTLVSFNQEDIKNELDRIKQAANDYKNMTEEEKNNNSISLEDLMNKLNLDDK